MPILAAFRRGRELRKIIREQRAEDAFYQKKIDQARKAKKSAEAIEEIGGEWSSLSDCYDDQIDTAESGYLVMEAQDYRVPVPEFDPNGPWWERARHSGRWRLTQSGRVNLLAAIRAERKARWEEWTRWVPLISSVTGLLGVVVAILALFHKW